MGYNAKGKGLNPLCKRNKEQAMLDTGSYKRKVEIKPLEAAFS